MRKQLISFAQVIKFW